MHGDCTQNIRGFSRVGTLRESADFPGAQLWRVPSQDSRIGTGNSYLPVFKLFPPAETILICCVPPPTAQGPLSLPIGFIGTVGTQVKFISVNI